jgi:hypothetical protein
MQRDLLRHPHEKRVVDMEGFADEWRERSDCCEDSEPSFSRSGILHE